MKDVFKKMIDHPIATAFVVGVTSNAIAKIIRACNGTPASVVYTVANSATETKTE